MKPKLGRREKIKIREKISEMEIRKTIQKINETRNWFFRKNKIDKSLAQWLRNLPSKTK